MATNIDPEVTNLIPELTKFWKDLDTESGLGRYDTWLEFMSQLAPQVVSLSGSRLGSPARFEFARTQFSSHLPNVERDATAFLDSIAVVSHETAELFNVPASELKWITLLGLYGADGWVIDIDGASTICLAAELLIENPGKSVLLTHEAAHACHAIALGKEWNYFNTFAHLIFIEGLAIYITAKCFPEVSPGSLLWPGLSHVPDGEAVDVWFARCEASRVALTELAFVELDSPESSVAERYFLGSSPAKGLPNRSGYYLGLLVLEELGKTYAISELARIRADEVRTLVSNALAGLG